MPSIINEYLPDVKKNRRDSLCNRDLFARVLLNRMIMRSQKLLFLLLISILGCLNGFAQTDDVIKVDTSIVRLNVGVADRQGRPVTNLNKESFALFEDGVKQDISRFDSTVAPFSVVLLLDMSGSTLGFRDVIRQSAFRFIDALAPADKIAVLEFNDKVNLLNDFTVNRKSIANSVNSANGRGKTQLYKALDFALSKLANEGNRRKAIIVLTDGADSSLRQIDQKLLEKAGKTEIANTINPENSPGFNLILAKSDNQAVTIYPLALPTGDPSRLAEPTPVQTALYTASRARLRLLAERTGGTFNAINRLEDMGRIYATVAADLRALYTIEYAPADTNRNGKWRQIKIEVPNSELISRTRTGYYAR